MVHGHEPNEVQFKLCDMGQAHQQVTSRFTMTSTISHSMDVHQKRIKLGTVSFEAPEVFMKQIKTCESDIYAFAMVMYELLHPDIYHPWGKVFSCGSHDVIKLSIIDAVKSGKRPPVLEVSAYITLMETCWDQDPGRRPTPTELKRHISDLIANCANVSELRC